MDSPTIAERRLYTQHLARRDCATPGEVVRWLGAVQAQDLFGALYGVGLRMRQAAEETVEQAIADRSVVRTWPMRGTIHFVPPEDARWMLKLLARRVNVKYQGMRRKAGLTPEIIGRAGEVFARTLGGGKQLTRKEVYAALAEAGIILADPTANLHLLGYWAAEGLVCFGPRRGKQPTFALLDEWIAPGRQLEGGDALAELARRYFTSHGPATVHDFAWWTGLTMAEARTALDAVAPELCAEQIDGQTYWSVGAEAIPPRPSPDAYLLPAYDEFTVAYRDRSAFIAPAFDKADILSGIGPVMVVDGQMAGTWKRTLTREGVAVNLRTLRPLAPQERAALTEAAERYGEFVGLPAAVQWQTAE